MDAQLEDVQRGLAKSILSLYKEEGLFAKGNRVFPLSDPDFSPTDGAARLINKAALDMIGIKSVELPRRQVQIVLRIPSCASSGFLDQLKRVLKGETVYTPISTHLTRI